MNILLAIVVLYLALLLVELVSKFGHMPGKVTVDRYFPMPKAIAWSSQNRYGAMIVLAIIFVAIAYFNPDNIYIQTIGLAAWILFIARGIIGSVNFEPTLSSNIHKYIVDDIPNHLWWVFIPLALLAFALFCWYYLDVAIRLFDLNAIVPSGTGLFNLF